MPTPVDLPQITVMPSRQLGDSLYRWEMRLYQESLLDSEDHGDDFDSVPEALAHAYTVFEDLVHRRQLYPANEEQAFAVTVKTR